jgi:hypothetical protein
VSDDANKAKTVFILVVFVLVGGTERRVLQSATNCGAFFLISML